MRNLIFLWCALFIAPQYADAEILDLVKNTCRVRLTILNEDNQFDYRLGSGWVVGEDADNYYIMTAGHVVDGVDSDGTKHPVIGAQVQFFYPHMGLYVDTKILDVLMRAERKKPHTYHLDLALLSLAKQEINLDLEPLALADFTAQRGERIITYGCPDGGMPTMFFGRVSSLYGDLITIQPSPKGGRSGSAVMDEGGNLMLGLVVRQNGYSVGAPYIRQYLNEVSQRLSLTKNQR